MGLLNNIFGDQSSQGKFKARILVAEDSPLDRELIKRCLEKNGYEVIVALNGMEAVEMARSESPDLIVLDCNMPEMGGVEACENIKQILDTKNIPVIFLSGLKEPSIVLDCFEVEAETFLEKPLNPTILISHIKSALEESSQKV